MSKKHIGKNHHPDSLIVVMIPLIPRYHNKHFGATSEIEDTSYDNMLEEDQEILTLAKRDLALLKETRRKNNFGERFKNSAIYPHIIYLGQAEGENSLGEAVAYMERQHKCKKEEIRNLAINITAHGNPETIGTKKSTSFSPDDDMTGLAALAHGYISENIAANTKLSFYLLACNSGYVSYSEDEEEHVKNKIIDKSYAGKFFRGLQKEAAAEGVSMEMTVSGYRGFLGHDQNRLVATRKEEQTPKAGELAGADHVRFVIGNINSGDEIEVTIPKGYKFRVENVTKSLTTEEAFKHSINSSVLSSSVAAEIIPEDSVEEDKPESNIKDILGLMLVFTVVEYIKLQMKEEQKAKIVSEAKFIEELSRGLHEDLLEDVYDNIMESSDFDEIYDDEEEQKTKAVPSAEFLEGFSRGFHSGVLDDVYASDEEQKLDSDLEDIKLQMTKVPKAKIVLDVDFIKELAPEYLLEEAKGSDEKQKLDSDSDNDISDNEMLESAFAKGSNVAKLLSARQSGFIRGGR